MLDYHYSLFEDIHHARYVRDDIKNNRYPKGIQVFKPSLKRMVWLIYWYLFKFTDPKSPERGDCDCYFVSSGCWGCIDPEKKRIYINPWQIEYAPGGLIGVIRHEIIHIEEWEKTKTMTFEEREKHIEGKIRA